jgi:riboflavin kinase/FMN adenylyltransferase
MAERGNRAQPPALPKLRNGSVITVGTFDGVHRGHWAVLQEVQRHAHEDEREGVLVTFHPHPLRIVRPAVAPRVLTTPVEKEEILAESGLDYAVFLPFTPELAAYPPERFVDEILIERLQLRRLVIGHDHGFGKDRKGDVETLQRIGAQRGFDVHVVPAIETQKGPISSSSIRAAIEAGDMASATDALGRPYSVRGVVVRGEGRGHSLGFATANIRVPDPDKLLPLEGIYAVRAALKEGPLAGVLHLGPRPTFSGSPPSIELHLFDFDADLYGVELRVDFHARIRAIHHYATVPELIRAIEADCEAARSILRSTDTG